MSGAGAGGVLAGVPRELYSLLPELCEELRLSLSAAREAADGGDAAETQRLAHAFKSAAMFYGLPDLASPAGLAEEAARSGRLGEARKALTRCAELLGELESACAGMDET